MMTKLKLILWKNLLLRRRHYIVTALEILFPILFAVLLVKIKIQGESQDGVGNGTDGHVFPIVPEDRLKLPLNLAASCSNCYFGYAPENEKTIRTIAQLHQMLSTARNDFFRPFKSEADIEMLFNSLNFNNTARGQLRGAVIFQDGLDTSDGTLAYKIRFIDQFHDTGMLFPFIQRPGPNIDHSTKYADSGFIGLQICIDKILGSMLTNRADKNYTISLQAFPYPPFISTAKDFEWFYSILLPNLFVVGFIFMVPSITRAVLSEKESGIRELLKLNGVSGQMQLLGWMIICMLTSALSITVVIFLLFWTFEIKTGAVVAFSDPTLLWLILFLYAISASSFCFFTTSFFQKPTIATTVAIILWLASYFFFIKRIDDDYETLSLPEKLAFCFIPNMGIHLGLKIISVFEGKAVGVQWANIIEPLSSADQLSLGHVILMFLISTTLYMLLTVYMENVFPSQYGIRKPWYYIFQINTWRPPRRKPLLDDQDDCENNTPGFEAEPEDAIVGVHIKNLRKQFGRNRIAVNGVSAKMYDGEIFALLGHNGAGKTTTISMLTGFFSPSGGSATINGFDITTDMDSARQSIGLCPQHNMLFDKLTVSEHLRFFGQLKGLSSSEATKESKDILKKLQLSEKETALSMTLSGGQKRKLSLGIALIGGTKVVILDEPTSGMDPEARRAIWDLLLAMRHGRTILLTTHFLEEADVLGDRVGIMANGKLQCSGTPMFLKKFYGTGYNLKISLDGRCQPQELLRCVQSHIPDASIKTDYAPNVEITLPTETASTAKLSEMFSQLSEYKEEFGIKSMALSITTMDDVFLRVGQLAQDNANGNRENGEASENGNSKISQTAIKSDQEKVRGLKLAKEQFVALLTKKYIYTLRNGKLMLSQLILPVVILAVTILLSNATINAPAPLPKLKLDLDGYKQPLVTLVSSSSDPSMAFPLTNAIGPSVKEIPSGSTLIEELTKLGISDLAGYREKYIIAIEVNQSNVNAMFNTIPSHAAPLAINLATNALLKRSSPNGNYRIQVTNHPLQSRMDALLEAAKPDPVFAQTVPIMFAVFMPIGLALLAASFIVFPLEERLCKAKQLQMMTGISRWLYWCSSFAWDFFVVFIVICAMTACFPIFQNFAVFTSYGGAGVAFIILLIYGFSAISFSYVISLCSSTVAGGFAFVSIIHIASGLILCVIVHVMEIGELLGLAEKIRWVGRLFPTFGAAISTMRYSEIAFKNGRCNILSEEAKSLICDPNMTSVPSEYRECCSNCVELGADCFKPTSYITWSYKKTFMSKDAVPGIGQELTYMMLMGVIYQIALMLLEYGILYKIFGKISKAKESGFHSNIDDEDVSTESQRVTRMVLNGTTNDDALVIDNFCKSYGSLAAVCRLSFGVHHGECFGLLGVNGAGKTTTFKMLTGDESRSGGNAFSFMATTLEENQKAFLSNIGYCPQFDGVIGVLSGKEMLQLFCSLRGVPGKSVEMEADKWLNKLGLSESANVQCRNYSGGMKRRLSVAIAMVGDPPLLLLDEPTSGVDPVSRRQFWQVLGAVKDSGQSIILTSHSMEECEALCSRLGIMVNGQLQCVGGVQYLKNKFAQGYSLSLKLKPTVQFESEELSDLSADIIEKFAPCSIKDKHKNVVKYQVHNTTIPWNILFKNMEDLKGKYGEIIEDYSVNETTLEEIFLSFARKQYGNRKADVSLLKRIITCQFC